jgi:hypothetical protein
MNSNDRVQLKVYVTRAQRDKLNAKATEREQSVGALIRDHIRTLTGEADPIAVKKPRAKKRRKPRSKT